MEDTQTEREVSLTQLLYALKNDQIVTNDVSNAIVTKG